MRQYKAIDTETDGGKAFILSHDKGVFNLHSYHDFLGVIAKLGTRFVLYNLDYDVSALLRHWPNKVWRKIYVEKRAEFNGVWMRYFPHKLLKIGFRVVGAPKGVTLSFFDLFSFFQCSLDRAAKICGIKQRKVKLPKGWITDLKRRYDDPKTRSKVVAYAVQDTVVLQKMADKVTAALEAIGLGNVDLYSPGYIAKRYLMKRGVSFGKLPWKYHDFVRQGYHGARIEVFQRGHFPKAYGADLKSAYPAAFAQLPDIAHASYYYTKFPAEKYFICKCKVSMDEKERYLLPYYKGGINYFPRYTGQSAWLTNYEYNYLLMNDLADVKPEKTLNVECLDTRPYAEVVQELFDRRKIGGLEGILYKSILTSMYGIAAEQRVDYREISPHIASMYLFSNRRRECLNAFVIEQSFLCKHAMRYWEKKCACNVCKDTRMVAHRFSGIPKWVDIDELEGNLYRKEMRGGRLHNLVVAAFVTAQVRVKVFDKLQELESPIAVFTDGIFSEDVIPGVKDKALLGDWEDRGAKSLLMVGSGVYQYGRETKMRGFRYKKSLRQLLAKSDTCIISIPQNKRASMGVQLRQHVEGVEMNEIFESEKQLYINFDQKRRWNYDFRNGKQMLRYAVESKPKNLLDI